MNFYPLLKALFYFSANIKKTNHKFCTPFFVNLYSFFEEQPLGMRDLKHFEKTRI